MPNHKISNDQLKQWYQNFKKELYEKANIDVTRKEDLGRVKNFEILSWTEEGCSTPQVDCQYVFVPRNGREYVTPPPDWDDFDEYSKWLMDNLRTEEPSIEQMQELYNMSREGTLMAYGPLGGFNTMMQIYTDEFGKIETSPPMMAYDHGSTIPIPEDKKAPISPLYVEEPNLETFPGFKTRPVPPEKPENMNPGFWSFIGHLLGFRTDYTKKLLYESKLESYPEKLQDWKNNVEDLEPDVMAEFRMAEHDREIFEREFREFVDSPIGKACAITNGYRWASIGQEDPEMSEKVAQFWVNEEAFFKKQHAKTPQGVMFNARQKAQTEWDYLDRNKRVVRHLLGHEPNGNDLVEWRGKGMFTMDEYAPTVYELPAHPKGDAATNEEKSAYNKKLAGLAEIANFAVLADSAISGDDYEAVLYDLITVGSDGPSEHFSKLKSARAFGMQAITEYHEGKPEALAELIANSVRQTNQVISGLNTMDEHAMNTLYLADRLMTALKENEDLRTISGLNENEMQEIAANAELYNVMRRGLEGKMKLLDYGLHQNALGADQLRQASLDVMFAAYVEDAMAIPEVNGQENFNVRDLTNSDWVAKQKENMLGNIADRKVETMSREDLGSIFAHNNLKIRDMLTKPASTAPVNKQAEPEPAKVLEEPNRQQNGFAI